jgi:serine/threonine protein kinase
VKLKDFKVLKVIGVGSFGKVYLVKRGEDEIYAMKVINKMMLEQ